MSKGLSNFDIMRLLNNKTKIISYPDIHKYKNLDELLYPYDCFVILYETKPNYGHWTCVIKRDRDNIEFFNSYGQDMGDDSLNYINKNFRKKTNQWYPFLSELLINSKYNLHYNQYRFQKDNPKVTTCGNHVCFRITFKKLDIDQYKQLLDILCKKLGFNNDYDKLVSYIVK